MPRPKLLPPCGTDQPSAEGLLRQPARDERVQLDTPPVDVRWKHIAVTDIASVEDAYEDADTDLR